MSAASFIKLKCSKERASVFSSDCNDFSTLNYYYADILVGYFPKFQSLNIDTGSIITAIPEVERTKIIFYSEYRWFYKKLQSLKI